MSKDWIEENKHLAKDAFDRRSKNDPDQDRTSPRPPQPQLTPDGQLRSTVDMRVREQEEAKRARIEQRKKAIQKKFEQDRAKAREMER